MSYFTPEDTIKLVEYLSLSPSQKIILVNRQNVFYNIHGDAGVARIREILGKLDEIEELNDASALDGNSQLKKASTLEWFSPGEGRFTRVDERRNYQINKLIHMLDLVDVYRSNNSYGGRS